MCGTSTPFSRSLAATAASSSSLIEKVFGRLGNLDDAPAANRAVDSIRGLLLVADKRLNGYLSLVADHMTEIKRLIVHLKDRTPAPADENNFDDVARLFGEVQTLMVELSGWVNTVAEGHVQQEEARRG